MRAANPEDLEQLAKLLDGKGAMQDKLDAAFTRASTLNVAGKLTLLKPMRPWADDTAPDLRKRAGVLRAEKGDPLGGLLWAGFSMKDAAALALNPDLAILVGAAAASGERKFDWVQRQPNETFGDWRTRVMGDAVTKITNDKNMGEVVSDYIALTEFAASAPGALKVAGMEGWKLFRHFKPKPGAPTAALKAPGSLLAQILRGQGPEFLRTRLAPFVARVNGIVPAPVLDIFAGSNKLAPLGGGRWAWEANLLKVGKNQAALKGIAGAGGFSRVASGAGAALSTAGFWRATGIAGGVVSTGLGAYDLYQQGNPVEAFKKDKAGYVSDVSGTLFNASLTAAMVAPNPITIGAAVVTGAVYGVSSIIDNWETVEKFPGKVADAGRWVGGKVSEGAGKLADGAKKLGSALNPFD